MTKNLNIIGGLTKVTKNIANNCMNNCKATTSQNIQIKTNYSQLQKEVLNKKGNQPTYSTNALYQKRMLTYAPASKDAGLSHGT